MLILTIDNLALLIDIRSYLDSPHYLTQEAQSDLARLSRLYLDHLAQELRLLA